MRASSSIVGLAYLAFERAVIRQADTGDFPAGAQRRARRRSLVPVLMFAAAIPVAIVLPWLAFALICAALVLSLRPEAPAGSARAAHALVTLKVGIDGLHRNKNMQHNLLMRSLSGYLIRRKPMSRIAYKSIDTDGDQRLLPRGRNAAGAASSCCSHGFPTSSHMFRDLIPLLANRVPHHRARPARLRPVRATTRANSFDSIADTIERFTEIVGFDRFAVYVFGLWCADRLPSGDPRHRSGSPRSSPRTAMPMSKG